MDRTGILRHVSVTAKVPGIWHKLLAHVESKKELFSFLSKNISEETLPDEKDVHITAGNEVRHVGAMQSQGSGHSCPNSSVTCTLAQTSTLGSFILKILTLLSYF